MNGRQRSGAAAVHHQRQLSDNPLDMSSSNGRWLQSTGLQHFQSSANVISESDPFLLLLLIFPSIQKFKFL
ncbi:hypothetical protein ARALYDRAFT_920994 [Arabidopsis lyrata subsp. lyrata]|uniref:Uncharacterized protein n=1 Tax=Arabidopsis lyrata subsp. lyrata TaxID=81972 RepID=D7MY60_ARALL|nr:hypothetical protein ARALYDRAFT_920994 [Arabidopsis lyrata subsp. lyrata]